MNNSKFNSRNVKNVLIYNIYTITLEDFKKLQNSNELLDKTQTYYMFEFGEDDNLIQREKTTIDDILEKKNILFVFNNEDILHKFNPIDSLPYLPTGSYIINQKVGGKRKKQQKFTKSNQKLQIGNQTRVVYLGARGGRYIKMGGNIVPVSKLNKK